MFCDFIQPPRKKRVEFYPLINNFRAEPMSIVAQLVKKPPSLGSLPYLQELATGLVENSPHSATVFVSL